MKKAAKKRSKKHPIKQQQMIVLVDRAGNYYEFPRATLGRSRVKEHRKKQVDAALKDEPPVLQWIQRPTIPGSVAAMPLKGDRYLQYAGYYLSSSKAKR